MEAEHERSAERLVSFTDAVVAIAITLLVLPLADAFSARTGSAPGDGSPSALLHLLHENLGQIVAFLLSFVLIARLWWAHHGLFAPVRSWSQPLVLLDLAWTLTIVVIPVTTAILPNYASWPLSFGIYCGTLLVSSVMLTGMAAVIHRSDAVTTAHGADTRNRLINSAVTLVAFAVALVLGLALPHVAFFALLLLAVTGPFEGLLHRRYARRDAEQRTP